MHTPSGFFGQGTGKKIKATGEWIHVALTYGGPDDRYMRLYENGVQIWSKDAGGALMDQSNYTFRVGASSWVFYPFKGSVDELRVYNRALSAAEIKMHYQSEMQRYNASEYRFYVNVSGLSTGTYSYYGWANDSKGNAALTDSGDQRHYTYTTGSTTPTTAPAVTTTTTAPTTTLCNIWVYDAYPTENCVIDLAEVVNAINDWEAGRISLDCVVAVQNAWAGGIQKPGCSLPLSSAESFAESASAKKDRSLVVSLLYPANDSIVSDIRPEFSFRVIGYTLLYNCSLYVNGSLEENTWAKNDTEKRIKMSKELALGSAEWYITCTDYLDASSDSPKSKFKAGPYTEGMTPSTAPVETTTQGSTTSTEPEETTTTTLFDNSSSTSTEPTTSTTLSDNSTSTTVPCSSTSTTFPDTSSTTLPGDPTSSTLPTTTTQPEQNASTTSSTGPASSTTTEATTTTVPPGACWEGTNGYLYKNANQYRKFCKCASGTYGYKDYFASSGSKTAYKYADASNNEVWDVSSLSTSSPVYQVRCPDMEWYPTNATYAVWAG